MVFKVFLVAFVLLTFSCKEATPELPIIFPVETWQKRTPEELQVDSKKLQEALDYLASESGEDGVEEVFIVRKGYAIFQGDSIAKKHNIYESTTAFTSALLCLLNDLDIVHFYMNAKNIDPELEEFYPKLKLKHFASMTSGYNAKGENRFNKSSEDWSTTPYEIDTPLFAPGEEFAYWDEAQMMLGRLLTIRTKKALKEVFDDNIGDIIGIGDYEWITEGEVNEIPINNAAAGILMNAEQLARFGHLFLNEGHWDGKQILSRYWIRDATYNKVDSVKIATTDRKNIDGRGSYGYNWWVNGITPSGEFHMPDAPKSLYYASSQNNNMCFVIPEWDMVFVRRGEDGNPKKGKAVVYNEFFKRMALAIKK